MWFHSLQDLLRVGIVAIVSYSAMIIIVRFAGKRSLAKLNAFDLVVTIALGSVLSTAILSSEVAVAEGAFAFAALAVLQWIVAQLSVASPVFRRITRSEPRLLVKDGEYRLQAMADERITRSEICAALRKAGFVSIGEAGAVVLETDGELSVLHGRSAAISVLEDVRQ